MFTFVRGCDIIYKYGLADAQPADTPTGAWCQAVCTEQIRFYGGKGNDFKGKEDRNYERVREDAR